MKIRVAELPTEPVVLSHTWAEPWVSEVLGETGFRATAPCTLQIEASLLDQTLILRGEIECKAVGVCSRCLSEMEIDLSGPIAVVLEPRRLPEDWEVDDQDAEDIGFEFYDGRTADLEPRVREHLALGIPMQAVCRDDCRGLCPDCGANLNDGPCGCHDAPPGRRL